MKLALQSLEEAMDARAVPFMRTSFEAFKCPDGLARTYPLGRVQASTLDEAINGALVQFALFHKDVLTIRETGENGVRLHVYQIKRKSHPRWVHKDHVTKPVHDLYPVHVVTLDGDVLAGAGM